MYKRALEELIINKYSAFSIIYIIFDADIFQFRGAKYHKFTYCTLFLFAICSMPGHIHRSTSGASAGLNSTHEHSRLECRGAHFLVLKSTQKRNYNRHTRDSEPTKIGCGCGRSPQDKFDLKRILDQWNQYIPTKNKNAGKTIIANHPPHHHKIGGINHSTLGMGRGSHQPGALSLGAGFTWTWHIMNHDM